MYRAKIKAITLITLFLFFVGSVGTMFIIHQAAKQTEDTTTYRSATVQKVSCNDTGKVVYLRIYTQEYYAALLIPPTVSERIDLDVIRDLPSGTEIFFRVENAMLDQIDGVEFVHILSLEADENEIFSLEDYNAYMKEESRPAKIACAVVILLLAAGFVLTAIFMKRKV